MSAARNLLVVGSGGREHAIVWALAQSLGRDDTIFCCPGNGGTGAFLGATCTIKNVALAEPASIVNFAQLERVCLAVIGPEMPLAAGIVGA